MCGVTLGDEMSKLIPTYIEQSVRAEPAIKESLIAQRPWVGLTGTEINHIFAANVGYPERMMKEVETLLKDKNT